MADDRNAMWQIHRAAHFEWRRAAVAAAPGTDPVALVCAYWREVGQDTARAWLRRVDRSRPLAPQVSALVVESSRIMGETAHVTDEGFTHTACPWSDWHGRFGLVAEDRPGCDAWLAATIDALNRELGARLRFETLEAIPEGGATCRRRVWEEAG